MSDPNISAKSHVDYVDVIGGTNATGRNRIERQWNRYYLIVYQKVVRDLLRGSARGTALDVGTSHGNWFPFLARCGFAKIWGVDMSPERARAARKLAYTEVFNCDAADVPLAANSIDVAISNDVFIHILQKKDKIRVLKKIEELLVPGGIFVLNHASAMATFNAPKFRINDYCSFISLDELIRLVHENTGLRVVDARPTYFNFRFFRPPLLVRAIRRLIALPLIPDLVAFIDLHWSNAHLPLEASDCFYLKLEKKLDATA